MCVKTLKSIENSVHQDLTNFGFDMKRIQKVENGEVEFDWDEDIVYLDEEHRTGIFNSLNHKLEKHKADIQKYKTRLIHAIEEFATNKVEELTSSAVRVSYSSVKGHGLNRDRRLPNGYVTSP